MLVDAAFGGPLLLPDPKDLQMVVDFNTINGALVCKLNPLQSRWASWQAS